PVPIPRSRYMDELHPTSLHPPAQAEHGARLEGTGQVNELAELVADLIEATGLVPADRLAAARGRAGTGSLAQALVDDGLADGEGLARALAERHRLPYVDIVAEEVSPEAIAKIPLSVLSRTTALPYHLDGGRLRVAIADPA